ncbi:hypothetical protein GCM10009665_60020 [Kitasatospora nipponensis]|uniref:Uncharacterized protein n=1 Tax=Kitasatospora nipponensis TaxID=258049 RepID=A0ABP4HEQ3_9ACTN
MRRQRRNRGGSARGPLLRRFLAAVHRSLGTLGAMYGFMPPNYLDEQRQYQQEVREALRPPAPPPLSPPAADHPERVRGDIPLSATELVLQKELDGLTRLSRQEGW